jgi:hypothetical protein
MMSVCLTAGEKIHVITRRLFDTDLRRHFAGVVEAGTGGVARVKGYAFIFDDWADDFKRRPEERIRLFSLIDAGLIINILPDETEISELKYKISHEGHRVVTDGKDFSLDVSEFTATR